MAAEPVEITVKLSPRVALFLSEVAELQGSTLEAAAERVIAERLDQAPYEGSLEELFDATPGFYERYVESLAQIERGETVPASELRER